MQYSDNNESFLQIRFNIVYNMHTWFVEFAPQFATMFCPVRLLQAGRFSSCTGHVDGEASFSFGKAAQEPYTKKCTSNEHLE